MENFGKTLRTLALIGKPYVDSDSVPTKVMTDCLNRAKFTVEDGLSTEL